MVDGDTCPKTYAKPTGMNPVEPQGRLDSHEKNGAKPSRRSLFGTGNDFLCTVRVVYLKSGRTELKAFGLKKKFDCGILSRKFRPVS